MDGSRTIRVLKRDGSVELFDAAKLACSMWRAMRRRGRRYDDAVQLSLAMEIYLNRSELRCISSAAILEMALKVLKRVRMNRAAAAMERRHNQRAAGRRKLIIRHDDGKVTYWDKTWLVHQARGSWHLSSSAARIIAGRIEDELLAERARTIDRAILLERLNATVAAYGLADAVPVVREAARS